MGRNNAKYIILILLCTFFSCKEDVNNTKPHEEKQVEIIRLKGKQYLNQTIYRRSNGTIFKSKSRYYLFKDNCLQYFTNIDTNKFKLGINRFVIYKTSNDILSDFSNIDKIKLKEHYFKNNNEICFENNVMPKNGFIEDIIFLKTDKKIDGEEAVRIVTKYMYVDLEKAKNQYSNL